MKRVPSGLTYSIVSLSVTIGSFVNAPAAWSNPTNQQVLLAQQVIDGLPPPPPSSRTPAAIDDLPPALYSPAQQPSSGVAAPAGTSTNQPYSAPPPALTQEQYLVLVNGDSPLLLEQVQKVDAGAFVQQYGGQRVIQAGLFSEAASAQSQVQALAAQGIGAEMVAVSNDSLTAVRPATEVPMAPAPYPGSYAQTAPTASTQTLAQRTGGVAAEPLPTVPVQREVVFGQSPSLAPSSSNYGAISQTSLAAASTPYFIAIPGNEDNLRAISVRVTQLAQGLNVAERSIEERDSPLGPHVLVGPFIDRSTAFDWDKYFRAFGLDSRVYYQR